MGQDLKRKKLEIIQMVLGVSIPIAGIFFILDIPAKITNSSLYVEQYLALLWALVTALIFVTVPFKKNAGIHWFDIILAIISIPVGLYVTFFYNDILQTLGWELWYRSAIGLIAVLLVFESIRRMVGWAIVIIVGVFIIYARFGYLFSGVLSTEEIPWLRLFTQLYVGSDFLFGTPMRTAASIVLPYILFGSLLFKVGGGEFFVDLAKAALGRFRGGPAKAAVVASSLFGMVSGSAVANVASAGMVTIPLMKRVGYSPAFAGAVEAVSGTGGCIMPPVMGAAAFIMADFLSVPYAEIAFAAAIPAILYYLGDFIQIDLRAAKLGLKGLPREELPSVKETIKNGWIFIIPLLVLIFALFVLFQTAEMSALYATLSLFLLMLTKKETRALLNGKMVLQVLHETGMAMRELVIVCGGAGFIVGLASYTGLSLSLSQMITGLAGGNLFLLAVLTAVTSIILGMGMPVVPAYLLLAVLAAPAMVNAGVEPLVAHMFIFYFGTLSFLTPPVCLAVFAAASIAGANMMKTAIQAMKLAIAAYIVPFVFIYNPGVLLLGSFKDITLSIITALIAIPIICYGLEGYCFSEVSTRKRILFLLAGILVFWPGWAPKIIGFCLSAILLLSQKSVSKSPLTENANT